MNSSKALDSEKMKAILSKVYLKDEQGANLEDIMEDLKNELAQMMNKEMGQGV
ncbi:hypothetical protein BN1058_00458 [Paraliobacillus sp. PM-2]|uniref:hypothetical protein n=1 Tax=Paraliobacillus sp. PM-2 TaxID=1462524 RepID=UPI00061BB0F5|nr:hypothetical protein [Paraliobacillus sp. PM-2]CQR46207.1 hypothetical protein BN1058_00458 [Paraliobacillus sp. PM-2]